MVWSVVTEELGGLWVQSVVRGNLYPRMFTRGRIFLFFLFIFTLQVGSRAQAILPRYIIFIYCLPYNKASHSYQCDWLITSLCWNQNTASWWLPSGMCVRVWCCVVADLNWLIVRALLPRIRNAIFCDFYLSALP